MFNITPWRKFRIQDTLEEVKAKELIQKYPQWGELLTSLAQKIPNKYLPWAVSRFEEENRDPKEIFNDVIDTANKFERALSLGKVDNYAKHLGQDQAKDINYWIKKPWWALEEFLDAALEMPSEREKKTIAKSGIDKIYEDGRFTVVRPKTHAASCFYGSGTKWCISARDAQHWDDYERDGAALIFIFDRLGNSPYKKVALLNYPDRPRESAWDENDRSFGIYSIKNIYGLDEYANIMDAIDKYLVTNLKNPRD
jgi:hypothetical protein